MVLVLYQKEGDVVMLTTFKATAKKLPEGLQVETNSRGFKILMDEPEDLGGTNAAMNPVEAILCALGACQTIVASAFAPAHEFTFEEFHVELEGDLDPDGFMGLADVRSGFQEIRFVMHFKTNEPKEKVESFAKFIENVCPVGDCLSNGVKLVLAGVEID
jgi:uncharacterized OsmC-like protein